jgi:hypothetical protein
MSEPGQATSRFRFVTVWPTIAAEDAAAVQAFWLREGAIVDPAVIRDRLPQVVIYAVDATGTVAGVCTAFPVTPERFGQPVYYWRTFVGAAWRHSTLVWALARRSVACLERYAQAHDFPCIGVMVELENDGFRRRGRTPVWSSPRFVYIGRSERGLDVRVHYFEGARLKPPAP